MSTLNKISLDGNVYNISNFHYIENNSASNPFIITEHEPGIYVVKGSDAGTMPGKLYSKYINSEDYYVRTDNFNGFLCLTDTSIDETYQYKNIGYIFDASQALTHPCYTQPAPYGMSLTSTSNGIGNSVVKTYDAQTVSGKKTFNVLPESSVTPTTDNQLTNKKYVDSCKLENASANEGNMIFGPTYDETSYGEQLTSLSPSTITNIKIGQVYVWINPTGSGMGADVNYAVVTGILQQSGTNYTTRTIYMGNQMSYVFAYDSTKVYKGSYGG